MSAIFDDGGRFEGHTDRECGDHRTVGPHRAWCFDCTSWCYPDVEMACPRCELPALRARVAAIYVDNLVINKATFTRRHPTTHISQAPAVAYAELEAMVVRMREQLRVAQVRIVELETITGD